MLPVRTIEQAVLSGHGHVDVALERAGLSVGCEISVTTSAAHEAENLLKCLSAGFDFVVLLSSSEERLAVVRRQLDTRATDPRLRFLTLPALAAFLNEVALASGGNGKQTAATSPRASHDTSVLGAEEAAAYIGLARQTLAKMRVHGDSPPYFKVGSRVVYNRADLDAWLAQRRRRSTSDRG